jgi:hypothetical protein
MKLHLITCGLVAACSPHDENLGNRHTLGDAAPASVGTARWALALGTTSDDRAWGTAVDSIGDVVVVGDSSGPAAATYTPVAGFVTKRTASDGSERWTRTLALQNSSSVSYARGVAIDAHDDVIVVGSYVGTVDFGGQMLTAAADSFVAKYSSDGQLQWVRGLDRTTGSGAMGVAVDSAGRIFVTGHLDQGTVTFAGTSLTGDSDEDGYVLSFDASGTPLWGTAFHGTNGPQPESIATGNNGDVWIAGEIAGVTSFGGTPIDPVSRMRGFLVRYRNDGLFLSSQALGPATIDWVYPTQVAVSSAGQVIAQTFERSTAQPMGPGYTAVYVFDASAQALWSAQVPTPRHHGEHASTLATAPSGHIVSSMWSDAWSQNSVQQGSAVVDPDPDSSSSMYLTAFDQSGGQNMTTEGKRVLLTPGTTVAHGSAIGSAGAIAIVGELTGTVDFGTGPVEAHGNHDLDAFVVLIDPTQPL